MYPEFRNLNLNTIMPLENTSGLQTNTTLRDVFHPNAISSSSESSYHSHFQDITSQDECPVSCEATRTTFNTLPRIVGTETLQHTRNFCGREMIDPVLNVGGNNEEVSALENYTGNVFRSVADRTPEITNPMSDDNILTLMYEEFASAYPDDFYRSTSTMHSPANNLNEAYLTVVPQTNYNAHHGHRVFHSSRNVVDFTVHGQRGIRLADITTKGSFGLDGSEDTVFGDCRGKISYRLQWPDYPAFAIQKHARRRLSTDWCSVTRAKVARDVKDVVSQFIWKHGKDQVDSQWKVGEHGIKVENIILLSIKQVSAGSWQPELAVTAARYGAYVAYSGAGQGRGEYGVPGYRTSV
ncbi:hypothetical protein NM688_g4243 [Phlebia brevispora]|uniref:Uncharacterized protein n=1 Tax=Phlebia brevispora TaxID=194682 RepID=A0ACC1T3N5_9APHY|nr:hypothetical protein NM688_g4243 [Phlebia brevispora]